MPGDFDFSAEAVRRVVVATVFVFTFGMVVSQLVIRRVAPSLITAGVKALLFLASYVAFFDTFDRTARPDDLVYLTQGSDLLDQLRSGPWSEISLIHTAQSFHFFYIIPVAVSIALFGEHYHSMVALNIGLSFLCAAVAYAIVLRRYESPRIAGMFFIVFALSPDLVSWTTMFAGKDTWVLLGHLIFLYALVLLEQGQTRKGVLWIAFAVVLTVNLRFYVPLFFLGLIAIALNRRSKYVLLGLAGLALVLFPDTARALLSLTRTGISSLAVDPMRLVVAIPRFWLTPRPFLEDEIHGFLRFASMINWMLLPVMLIGLYRCQISKDRFARFLVLYFMVFSVFYGSTDALSGPRQRLQLLFSQLFFLWIGLAYVRVIPARLRLWGFARPPSAPCCEVGSKGV